MSLGTIYSSDLNGLFEVLIVLKQAKKRSNGISTFALRI